MMFQLVSSMRHCKTIDFHTVYGDVEVMSQPARNKSNSSFERTRNQRYATRTPGDQLSNANQDPQSEQNQKKILEDFQKTEDKSDSLSKNSKSLQKINN